VRTSAGSSDRVGSPAGGVCSPLAGAVGNPFASLYKMAVRIRARAIRRAGELLAEIDSGQGKRTDKPCAPGGTKSEAADSAGLSRRQKVTALRVAAVPKEDFERAVESDRPPTIPAICTMSETEIAPPGRT
jgi:hypothetical protein